MSPAVLLCLLLAQPAPGDKLAEGVALYRSGQPGQALAVLLDGLDQPASKRQRAEMRLYIGLIQFGYGREDDARASFTRALELDGRTSAPAEAPAAAAQLFDKVKRELPSQPRIRKRAEKKVAPPPPPEKGPELLAPANLDPPHNEERDLLERASVSTEEELELSYPIEGGVPKEATVPVLTWVMLGTGAAVFLAGVVLSALASADNGSALDDADKGRAHRLQDRARAEHAAALVSFVGAGVLVGGAAVSLSF